MVVKLIRLTYITLLVYCYQSFLKTSRINFKLFRQISYPNTKKKTTTTAINILFVRILWVARVDWKSF